MRKQKYQRPLKASLLVLSDGSFSVCIPLWDEEMDDFRKEIKSYFEKRGEETFPPDFPLPLAVFTKFEGEQLVRLSDRLIRKVLKKGGSPI